MRRYVYALLLVLSVVLPSPAQEMTEIKNLDGWVGAVNFRYDSEVLAVGTSKGTIYLWGIKEKEEKPFYKQTGYDIIRALYIIPGSDFLTVIASEDRLTLAHVRKVANDPISTYRYPGILSLVRDEEGGRTFIGCMDGTLARLGSPKERKYHRDHTSWVNSLAIDKGRTLLASGSSDNTIHVRTLKDLKIVNTFRVSEGEVRSVAISPDGKLLAAGIRYGWVRVWDLERKKVVFSTKAHEGETMAVAFTPDGKTLASGGGDWNKPGEVRLYDVASWKERKTLKHSGEVLCLAISPDGRLLAAGAWDRTVRVWELNTKKK